MVNNMADRPVATDIEENSQPSLCVELPSKSDATTPVTTESSKIPTLPNCGGGGDSCSTGTNSNASSTQNLLVTPNGYNEPLLQNGHLSASDDSGMGNMSDQGSQSSQSPNSSGNVGGSAQFSNTNSKPGYRLDQDVAHQHSLQQSGSLNYSMAIDPSLINQAEAGDMIVDSDDAVLNLPPGAISHHHQNHGSSSPNCYSPNHPHSRGSSPNSSQQGSPQAQPAQQHVVLVHVNPGETFSVRVGNDIQHIQGQ